MECRHVREMADLFLCEELVTETNHQIQRHIDACPSCRREIDDRHRLRLALRAAFERAPELQPPPGFSARLRERLHRAGLETGGRALIPSRWLAAAAAAVFVVALATGGSVRRWITPADTLVSDAIGDHRSCALKLRLIRSPVPLEDAAQRFDGAYRMLLNLPPDKITTREGAADVVERHSCAYGTRRFAHVVLRYHNRVVSLLVTARDGRSGAAVPSAPHLHVPPSDGLSVVSVGGTRHVVLLVGDLPPGSLTELAGAVSVPLSEQLQSIASREPEWVHDVASAMPLRFRD